MKTTITIKVFMLILLLSFQFSNSQLLYSNGNLSTGTVLKNGTIAPSGYSWSELQDENGFSNSELGQQSIFNTLLLADDFNVPAGQKWNISSLDLYFLKTNPPFNTIYGVFVRIYNIDPSTPGAVPIYGDATTDVTNTANSGSTNIYRHQNTWSNSGSNVINYSDLIVKINCNVNVTLNSGNYWIVYGSNSHESPTIVVPNRRGGLAGWNAKRRYQNVWFALRDIGFDMGSGTPSPYIQQELPFNVNGTSEPTILSNDACTGARVVSSFPYAFNEYYGGLATNNNGFIGGCGMNDGEWFTFVGNGNNVKINLTGVQADYDAKIGVFRGECGSLTCVTFADSGADGVGETVTISNTFAGYKYYINICNGDSTTDFPEGNFSIFIKQYLPNDECVNATNIASFPFEKQEIYGNLATNNNGFINSCTNGMNDGEWYQFNGTGRNVSIELSNVQNDYDPEIAVYTGLCSALTCEARMDIGNNGEGEKLTVFNTVAGTTYYVNIGNYSNISDVIEGNFKIKFKELILNDDCLDAINVPSLPFTYLENSGSLTSNNNGFRTECAVGMNDGEWFKIFGNGGEIRIDLTQVATNYDVEVGVYSGTCINLTCVTNRDNNGLNGGESLLFDSVVGQTYYINIGQFLDNIDEPEGNFKMDITTIVLANNSYDFKNLKMFPNPVTNILNLENSEKIESISISNLLGQELINQKNNDLKAQIDMSSFQNGAYLVKVNSENAAQVYKIYKSN